MFDETSILIRWHKRKCTSKIHLNVFFPLRQYLNGHLVAISDIYIQFDLIRLPDWFLIIVSCVHVRMTGYFNIMRANLEHVDSHEQSIN